MITVNKPGIVSPDKPGTRTLKSGLVSDEAMSRAGVVAELTDLIAMQRQACMVRYRPDSHAARAGNHLSKLRGRGMNFSEARNYQAGDEIRHMEWRVTARTGRPHVKVFQEEREQPVVILTDFNPSMYFGTRVAFKSVVAARLAALIAWTAAKQGDRVGGIVFSAVAHNEFTPRSRQSGVLPILAALSHYTHEHHPQSERMPDSRSLSHALLRLRRVAKPGSILVLISDFYNMDIESEQHLSRLSRHNDILAYHICDPLELAPPTPAQYAITNGRQEILLDTTLDAVRFSYQFYCEQRITALQAQCKRLQIQYMQITALTDLRSWYGRHFPGGAVVNKSAPPDLSSLHDIHMPAPVSWWPLAPGWYLLTAIILMTCLLAGFLCRRHYLNGRAKREALRTLALYQKQYEQDGNSQLCSAKISELLKRVALAYYPRTQVAGLQGDAWVIFLNNTVKGVNFNSVRVQLLELPWRPSKNQSLHTLFKIARKWIIKQGKPCSN